MNDYLRQLQHHNGVGHILRERKRDARLLNGRPSGRAYQSPDESGSDAEAFKGLVFGATVGAALGGPVGAVIGGVLGCVVSAKSRR